MYSKRLLIVSVLILLQGCQTPKYNWGLKDDNELCYRLDDFGQAHEEKYGVKLFLVGNVAKNATYCIVFTSERELHLDEGKTLAISLYQEFLQMCTTDPIVTGYAKKFTKGSWPLDETPRPENVGLKIAFWDNEINRPPAPYLSEILVENGTFHYYEAVPDTQALQLVFKESYEEAIARLPN